MRSKREVIGFLSSRWTLCYKSNPASRKWRVIDLPISAKEAETLPDTEQATAGRAIPELRSPRVEP